MPNCRARVLREQRVPSSGTTEVALDNDGLIINGQLRCFSYYGGHAAFEKQLVFGFESRHNADKSLLRPKRLISSKNFLLLGKKCGF